MSKSTAKCPRILAGAALVLVVLGGGLGLAGCSGLPKAELEERLLAIEKNEPVRRLGLQRGEITVELDGELETFELVHLRAPAESPADGNDRAPVVLVHGTPSTLFTWVDLVFGGPEFEGLRAGRDVWAIEVFGHGAAPGNAAPYDFERCANFVTAAIRGLGLERVHLVGNSYGGEFVWRAALNEPELIQSLVLMSSSGYERADGDWLPEEVEMRENSMADLGWLINSRDRVATALEPHYRELTPASIEEFFLVCENKHNWQAMIDLARDENGDREAEIADIRVPTLVLWGANDVAYGLETYGKRFAADIPDAELVVIPEAGHYLHEERPAAVVAELERFFGEQESGS